jgi:glucose/mannose-6-phosphate isomerase
LDFSTLGKYDSQKMYKIYDNWPEMARKAFEANEESINFEDIDHIVFAGMGGSGAIGDVFSSILSKTDIHVSIVKGYLLPKTVDKNTLVVVTSVSGNTSETLTILDSTQKIDCNVIVFSSGGKMEKICQKNQILFKKITCFHSPRTSLINFTYSILNILDPILPIEKKDVIESLNELEITRDKISSNNLTNSNPALNLAKWIEYIPLIYYPHGLQSAAFRFKNSLQENAKMHVITEDVIEACHNGIVSWEKQSFVKPILIKGKNDYIKTKERWEVLKEFFDKKNIDYYEIDSTEGSILSKIINLIYLFDYASIYRAIILEIDPSPVIPIEFIKTKLNLE